MPFPQSFLDELIARNDIVDVVGSYVSLTPKAAASGAAAPSTMKRLLRSMCCRTGSFTTASAAKGRGRHQLHHGH